jgi:hypothetical protein
MMAGAMKYGADGRDDESRVRGVRSRAIRQPRE